jgi:hypothetical protein
MTTPPLHDTSFRSLDAPALLAVHGGHDWNAIIGSAASTAGSIGGITAAATSVIGATPGAAPAALVVGAVGGAAALTGGVVSGVREYRRQSRAIQQQEAIDNMRDRSLASFDQRWSAGLSQ